MSMHMQSHAHTSTFSVGTSLRTTGSTSLLSTGAMASRSTEICSPAPKEAAPLRGAAAVREPADRHADVTGQSKGVTASVER